MGHPDGAQQRLGAAWDQRAAAEQQPLGGVRSAVLQPPQCPGEGRRQPAGLGAHPRAGARQPAGRRRCSGAAQLLRWRCLCGA